MTHPGFTDKFGGSYQDTYQNAKSYALYFDGTWEFIDHFFLLGGVRADLGHEER